MSMLGLEKTTPDGSSPAKTVVSAEPKEKKPFDFKKLPLQPEKTASGDPDPQDRR